MAPVAREADQTGRTVDDLSQLALDVQRIARAVDALLPSALDDGELSLRVLEASQALHRASLALAGEIVIDLAEPSSP
jgi:hypothetical protein